MDYQRKKELCKGHKEFGRKSEYFKGLLKATFSSNTLVPDDIKDLFACLLTQAEYLLWERTWKRLLQELLPELLQSPDCAIDADNNNISMDHLCSEGTRSQARAHSEKIAEPVLEHVKRAAEMAFILMPTKEPKQSYVNIEQSPFEAFIDVVERL